MTLPRIMILYNEPVLPLDHPDSASERDILDIVRSVNRILSAGPFTVRKLGIGNDLERLIAELRDDRPDAVFNLFEGLADRPHTETTVAGVLEWFGIPFTGCSAEALTLARDKLRTKLMLRGAGLPTPPSFAVERLPCPKPEFPWPAIVKPANQDASVGMDQSSVVMNQTALADRVERVFERFGGPVLVEQFIDGREFHVSVVDGRPDSHGRCPAHVLPLAEIKYKDPSLWPIYSYDAKWAEDSWEYRATPLVSPVIVPNDLMERICEVSVGAYRLLNCRDYARVDLRINREGQPFILEVNPNPFLTSLAMTNGLAVVGLSHPQFVRELVEAALARHALRKHRGRRQRRSKRSMQEAS